jgi:hypothetical protein
MVRLAEVRFAVGTALKHLYTDETSDNADLPTPSQKVHCGYFCPTPENVKSV